MKLILCLLFAAQLSVLSFWGILLLRGNTLTELLADDVVAVTLNFNDNFYDYQMFLDIFEGHGLDVSRVIFLDDESIAFYTTDTSLGNFISLESGRLPIAGTSEFISTIDTGELGQVGLISNRIPEYSIFVSGICNPQNFSLDGLYYIHTHDINLVRELVYELSQTIFFAEVFSMGNTSNSFFVRGLAGLSTPMQFYELILTNFIMFLILVSAAVQYSIGKLKYCSILSFHGYSFMKMGKLIIAGALIPLMIGTLISYAITIIHISYTSQLALSGTITLFLGLTSLTLIALYSVVIFLVVLLYMKKSNSISFVKGNKPILLTQIFNHTLKLTFSLFFLLVFSSSIIILEEVNQRLDNLAHWDKAKNIYRINITDVGQFSGDFSIERDYSFRGHLLFNEMSLNNYGFIMNTGNISFFDEEPLFFINMGIESPIDHSPHGNRITITSNFLEFNPIRASNGIPIKTQIIYDDYTLNLLVPEMYMPFEDEIITLYKEEFFFQKVSVANIYSRELGLQLNSTPIDDLIINIIYIEDNQYFFSFDAQLRPCTGGRILNPIAVFYTGNFDYSFLSAIMTTSFFFQTDAFDAYSEILPILIEFGLDSAIPRVSSVYDQNGRIIAQLQEQLLRLAIFIGILIVANITASYNLVANYYEKNKFKLFLKGICGYSSIRRNRQFIVYFSAYFVVFNLLFNGFILFVGIVFLLLDAILLFMLEKRMQRRTFSEIMKGER